MTASAESVVERARQLLAAATPGEWEACTAPHPDDDKTPAEWLASCLTGDRELWCVTAPNTTGDGYGYLVPAITGDGPFSEAHAALIATAPTLIAELCAIIDQHTRWKTEATEVIESWELVYEALGDVGGLGQRRSEAVLAEVLRMKAELDQHTDPDLAARLLNMSKNGYDPDPHEVLRAAARKLGGAT